LHDEHLHEQGRHHHCDVPDHVGGDREAQVARVDVRRGQRADEQRPAVEAPPQPGDRGVHREAGAEGGSRGGEVGRGAADPHPADRHHHQRRGSDKERDLPEGALRPSVQHADVRQRGAARDDDQDGAEPS
jgi:hypothetical protein